MIKVCDLRKAYGSLTAVDGIGFELRAGETFGLLGPNGAGKTTVLHLIAGLLRQDEGTIEIAGEADPTRPAVRRRLGLAPQAIALYEDLTGAENLAFFGRLYGLSGAALQARVDWALAFSGLAERGGDLLRTYSGGMQRRINVVCALIHEPKAVLLDEPTVGVDPQSRNHLFENIAELRRKGTTILYTTHYMEEAARLCDRVAIVDRGRILALDTVPRLIEAHGGSTQVTVELAEAPAEAAGLPGKLEGRTLRFATADPVAELARLAERGLKATEVRSQPPTLEEVFLNLTGRRLRD